MTIPAVDPAGGILFLINFVGFLVGASFALYSAIVLVTKRYESIQVLGKRVQGFSSVALTKHLALIPYDYIVHFVGKSLFSWNALRVALIYWIALPTLVIMFPVPNPENIETALPKDEWRLKESGWMVLAAHIWIWVNIFGDIVSLNVSRKLLFKIKSKTMTIGKIIGLLMIDLIVASVMVVIVIIATNISFLLILHQNGDLIRTHFVDTVFSWETIIRPMGRVIDSKVVPHKWLQAFIALSTFWPALFWIIAIMGGGLLTMIQNTLTDINRKTPEWATYLGVFITSFAIMISCLHNILQM